MLRVHSSNRLENLLQAFLQASDMPADPFEALNLVVQNSGMARWVAQQTALKLGVCANFKVLSPAQFLWSLPSYWDSQWPSQSNHEVDAMAWRIYQLLPGLIERRNFEPLQQYLRSDQHGVSLLQLSQRIATVFDRYLIYRQELIVSWESGDQADWQAVLWRALRQTEPGPHWGHVLSSLRDTINHGCAAKTPLPVEVSFFAAAALPPVHLQIVAALAQVTQVTLYYLNPCREYWADIVDQRGQARRRARARKAGLDDPTGLLDLGNPLLASWGLAGQAFLDQLLEIADVDSDDFARPVENSALRCLQADVLELRDAGRDAMPSRTRPADDNSIQIHSAHSALREVQILHDQLLGLFETLDNLKPHEIIVMAPTIDDYAPFIEATFSAVGENMRIPWTIADRPIRREHHLLEVLLSLLRLPESRFESKEMLSLLEVPAVARKLGLEVESIDLLRQWVVESGIRWSLDGAMRESLELPAVDANSWDFGLRRLFLGYAMPADEVGSDSLFAGVSPYRDIEGGQSEQLAVLQQLVDHCRHWRQRLQQPRSLAHWGLAIDALIEDFFAPIDSEVSALTQLRAEFRQSISQASEAGVDAPQDRAIVIEMLIAILDSTGASWRFLNGSVTCSNMVPMRSIPFRVVCLLGMNASAFPRDDRVQSFDLMAQRPQRGDRTRRSDDRYLFLETIISAREVYYLSYIGNDMRDNSPKAMATVVEELLSYLSIEQVTVAESDTAVPAVCVTQHPLQPFSKRYFNQQNANLLSYKSHWYKAACAPMASGSQPVFNDQPGQACVPREQNRTAVHLLPLDELISFFQKPAASYLRQQYSLVFTRTADSPEDVEPFALDGLAQWQVKQEIFDFLQLGVSEPDIVARLRARGQLPTGDAATVGIVPLLEKTTEFRRRLQQYQSSPQKDCDTEIDVEIKFASDNDGNGYPVHYRVVGNQRSNSINSLTLYRLGRLRAMDILNAWVRHLLLNAMVAQGAENTAPDASAAAASEAITGVTTTLVGETETQVMVAPAEPTATLRDLLQIYHQGQQNPLPLFPDTSWLYAKGVHEGTLDAALAAEPLVDSKIRQSWHGARNKNGESQQPAVDLLWRGQQPVAGDFSALAQRLFVPILDSLQVVNARDDLAGES